MRIHVYDDSLKPQWDEFVRTSKNGTFLFFRDYMDYHRDRFTDHSLVVCDDKGCMTALLPANSDGHTLISHDGLTYGGFITSFAMKMPGMLEAFDLTLEHLQQNAFDAFVYKAIPYIYHLVPAEEDRFPLHLCGARVTTRGVLTVVDSRYRLPLQERRTRGIKKAQHEGLLVAPSEDFASFWHILSERLLVAHGARPVHSLEEIELLHSRFPDKIKLFACNDQRRMLAGVVIYESERVARTQYIAATEEGLHRAALDLLFSELLTGYYAAKPFFDFGTSGENDGRCLNRGLIDQKESWGGRAVTHDHYEINVGAWRPGMLSAALVGRQDTTLLDLPRSPAQSPRR
jgi:hypothetical protein